MNKREKNYMWITINVIFVDKECSLLSTNKKRKDWSWSPGTWMWNGSHSQQLRAPCQPPDPERDWNDQTLVEGNVTQWSRLSLNCRMRKVVICKKVTLTHPSQDVQPPGALSLHWQCSPPPGGCWTATPSSPNPAGQMPLCLTLWWKWWYKHLSKTINLEYSWQCWH